MPEWTAQLTAVNPIRALSPEAVPIRNAFMKINMKIPCKLVGALLSWFDNLCPRDACTLTAKASLIAGRDTGYGCQSPIRRSGQLRIFVPKISLINDWFVGFALDDWDQERSARA